jgi:hypothetical protein
MGSHLFHHLNMVLKLWKQAPRRFGRSAASSAEISSALYEELTPWSLSRDRARFDPVEFSIE